MVQACGRDKGQGPRQRDSAHQRPSPCRANRRLEAAQRRKAVLRRLPSCPGKRRMRPPLISGKVIPRRDSLRQNECGGSQPAQHIGHKRRTRCRYQHVVAETEHSSENPVERRAEDANQSLNQGITADKIAPELTGTGNLHRACGHAAHENSEHLRVGGVTEENYRGNVTRSTGKSARQSQRG